MRGGREDSFLPLEICAATAHNMGMAHTMTSLDSTKTQRAAWIDPSKGRRSSRPQIWEATSADGRWTYIRSEEPGTPWHIRDNSTGTNYLHAATSLNDARRQTADPEDFLRWQAIYEAQRRRSRETALSWTYGQPLYTGLARQ